MATSDKQLRFDVVKDQFETWSKGANLLLVAHGAGLIGCVSILKDYNTTPTLRGVGMLVFIFGTGLMMAIVGYGMSALLRISATNAIISERDLRPKFANIADWTRLFALWGSMVSLCAAIWQFIIQFIAL